ncbi:putative Receptor expression-enhancing protein [Hibiscus syriacus]|uniref:Receptor expression-enhancing protein n=1 Tax=Hibiscus syriacus TaxID=106335 RepID=A0A6A3CH61_HIBSY|nr:putative Receptor expression-enhancing protein [Hibiscus syriacus]
MDDGLGQSPLSSIRRHNSISSPIQGPAKLTLWTPKPLQTATSLPNGSAAPSPLDLELISLKASSASYTSLKDILPSPAVSINSPIAAGSAAKSGYEISIRNRLVKHAAWAYLQPMSTSPDSSGHHLFRRLWLRFSSQNPISSCLRFFNLKLLPLLTRLVDRIFRSIGIIFNR